MKPSSISKIVETISALFILLFVYTAINKLVTHTAFAATIRRSPLIGFASGLLSWAIPIAELFISLLLFIPQYRRTGLYSALGLMTLFTIYIGFMLVTSSHLPCSCGGVLRQMSWEQHFLFNLFFTLLALAAILIDSINDKRKAHPGKQILTA